MALSKVIEFLVRGKCTPEYATSMCCMEDDVVVLKYLHEANYPLNKDTFYMCIKHDSIKCLEFLIRLSTDLTVIKFFSSPFTNPFIG